MKLSKLKILIFSPKINSQNIELKMSFETRVMEKAKSISEPQSLQELEEYHSQYVPTELERQLEFLDFNSDGHMLLGCSNLTGRYWIGSLWYYRDPDEAPSVEKALTGLDCDNGVVEGFFLQNGKSILAALDNGSLELLGLAYNQDEPTKPYHFLERLKTVQEHDDIITGMTLNSDSTKVVTSSYDKSVVVLDLQTLMVIQQRAESHSDLVSHVAANHQDPNIVATAGNDGCVSSWDIRNMSENTGCIYKDSSVWPSCVAWTPNSEHHLVVGTQNGSILAYDVRNPKVHVASNTSLSKQIYRMKFSQARSNLFAVSADNVSLHVFDLDPQMSGLSVKYCDKRHDDFIRGLAWHPKTDLLYSCGWDHKVYSHSF